MQVVRWDQPHPQSRQALPSQGPAPPGLAHAPLQQHLSIVIPAKNESASLPRLVHEVASAFRPVVGRDPAAGNPLHGYEILIVDDGSTDETPRVLHELRAQYPELTSIHLEHNVGQSAATHAGFHAARSEWVAILDADLQNDPADLARLWDAMPGHDAGLGWRVKRRDTWTKRVISRLANWVRDRVLGDSVRDTGCAVRIFPRSVALRLPMFHGAHRFYGPLLLREGCSIVQIPCNHRLRPHGRSHYNLRNRSLKVVVDLFGVAWLMRRPVRYTIREAEAQGSAGGSKLSMDRPATANIADPQRGHS
jgi:glycosyltransferase involved in cell wall biosynthesis